MKYLVIDRRVIKNNLRAVKERAQGAEIIADLSANASGMGLVETASLLRDEGVRTYGVSGAADAKQLRERGFTEERIMMLRSTADPDELRALIDLEVICTAGSYDAAVAINGIAESRGTVAEVQIKIDTGMGRYGFLPNELDKIAAVYKYMSSLSVIGSFTTFSASYRGRKQTLTQLDLFNDALDKLSDMGYEPGIAHAFDSAALFRYDFPRMDAVRVETALTGRLPGKPVPGLGRVGYIEAGLEEVGWYPKGHRIGLERGIITKGPTKVAILSVGYYHGFGVRRQSGARLPIYFIPPEGKLFVRINGQKARVIGEVGLLHTIVDVTKIECTVGDAAILDVDPVNVKGLPIQYR